MPTPWPMNVHPILIECIDVLCDSFKLKVQAAYVKPYFGYRSVEEQNALYAQGRAPLYEVNMQRQRVGWQPITELENKKIVTKARGGQSKHNAVPARAADLVIVRNGRGHLVWDSGIDLDMDGAADYIELGEVGEGLGLVWGGRFQMRDWGHFELPDEDTIEMKRLYEKFSPSESNYVGNEYHAPQEEIERERARYSYIYTFS